MAEQQEQKKRRMNAIDLKEQCEVFRNTLDQGYSTDIDIGHRTNPPLDRDFVCRFNGFVAEHPHVLEWKNDKGKTLLAALYWYLRYAIRRKFPLSAFEALVIQTPQVLAEKGNFRETLLFRLCENNPSALDVVSFFLQHNPDAAKVRNTWNRTPLVRACQNRAPLPVIRLLVDAYPRALQICDYDGQAPLPCACGIRGAPLDVIRYLVVQAPHLCLYTNLYGEMPLAIAKTWREPDDDVIAFMTTATNAVALVLLERFCFEGLPRDIFEHIMEYHNDGGAASMVGSVLFLSEMAVLFRRNYIRAGFLAQIQTN